MNLLSGEYFQQLCDIYIGLEQDFQFNPKISNEGRKHLSLSKLDSMVEYNNPEKIFCYGHRLLDLSRNINKFKNKCILIVHNSDENITKKHILPFINSNVTKIYAQNLEYSSPTKFCEPLPIGIANSQWEHGVVSFKKAFDNLKINKSKNIFMNFSINTNQKERIKCLNECMVNSIEFLGNISIEENIKRMSEYYFVICPEGNGHDTHRFWEALYLDSIPICLKSEFTLQWKNKLPMILLDTWSEIDVSLFNKNLYDTIMNEFNSKKYLTPEYYIKIV